MNILARIEQTAREHGERLAFHSRFGEITYRDLWERSGRMAAWIQLLQDDCRKPIVVYGHKSPYMLVSFLACVRSGRAYCPVDISMPPDRVRQIIEAADNDLVIATEPLELEDHLLISERKLHDVCQYSQTIDPSCQCSGTDIFYIIFTSGSTGNPKGVQISTDNLNHYLEWSVTLPARSEGSTFLNQAPYSFDLSVMDTYTALASGGTIWATDKPLQQNTRELMPYLAGSHINCWVSTPSFAAMCLADPEFNGSLLPDLRTFLFCGETLTAYTAEQLMIRFPQAKVINSYGPTEATVAVSAVEITEQMVKSGLSLPIGYPQPGIKALIRREDGSEAKPGETGEIILAGTTVSPGYFQDPERTAAAFTKTDVNGTLLPAYHTGDAGWLTEDGLLYYEGRIDLQVKYHGYRIELGDIESNLMQITGIHKAVVVPKREDSAIRHLAAFVVAPEYEGSYADRKWIREKLKERIPAYMVPKKIIFTNDIPMTNNGKADRKSLEQSV
ncbi:MAG: D-alanine--poly(phosphoribitol) ligase subunit DltA [Eubacterium sp.]|jgi:D-alanine--poly(phosphoribitol) ligase subunit 1